MSPEPEKIQPSPRTRAYVRWVLRYGRVLWILALLLAVPAVWRTARLYMTLRSDLESLLPPHAPSVVALEELRARTPGINTLGIVVDTVTVDNLPAGEKFLDDLAARVRAYPPDLVNGVRTGIAEERKFVEEHAPLYAELADLETVRKRIEERRDYESAKAAEVDFDDEPPPPLDFSDIEKRYKEKQGASERFPNDRYSSAKEHASIMLVEIGGYSTGIARSQALLDRVRSDVAALGGPEKYAPGMRIGFAGDPAISTEELSALEGDLTFSSLIVVGFVILVLLAYYQWWKAVPIIVLPLLISVAYSFSIAGFTGVDCLNSNTAFLGSIIVGNGINFGIILVARYVEERRHGCPVEEAIAIAVHGTRVGTITAAAAAGIAYGSLLITQFRGFWQFGAIGGIGMLVCWGVTFVLIPPLLRWFDHSDALRPKLITPRGWSLTGQLASIVDRFPAPILGIALAVSLAAVFGSRSFGPDRMETDFSKMRRSDTWQNGEGYWGRRMDAVLGRYLTPVVILTDNADQTRKIAAALREEAKTDPVLMQLVDSVRTVEDVLPGQQEAKLEQVKAVREIITPNIRSKIPKERRELVDRLLGEGALKPIAPAQLPPTFVLAMRERDGTLDRAVLVYPKPTGATWQGKLLISFAGKLRSVVDRFPTAEGRVARVAGSAPLSADLTESMGRDGPRATWVALAGVLVLVLLTFRFTRETVLIVGSIFVGVLWLIWCTMLFDVRINFANFIGFPITFGIGVDYAVNVMWRYRLDGGRDVIGAVRSTGGAVGLCSLTTIIGYSSLLLAKNQALFSFGIVAVIGEFTCLATAVIVLPAILLAIDRRRRAASKPASAQ